MASEPAKASEIDCKEVNGEVKDDEKEVINGDLNNEDKHDNAGEESDDRSEREETPSYASDEGEERDVLPDLYDNSEAGDTHSLSECRSMSEERSMTPDDLEDFEHMLMERPKPKVIVFDLDYTLWPFWVDRQINIELPFKQVVRKGPGGENIVSDATGRVVKSFPDVTAILQRLHGEGYKLGIASEAFYKDECAKLVKLFGWEDYIDYQEIYPGSKIFHFVKIKRASGVDFCDMLYFDDEKEHLAEVAGTCTGITTCWADRGVSDELIEEAFLTFAKNRESDFYFRSKPVTISRRNSTEPFVSLRPLVNLRRRNSVDPDAVLPPPPVSALSSAGLAALANGLPGLSLKDKNPSHHGFNPNLPGLNGPMNAPPRSKTRRRFSIM